ncbi:hypothetical protein NL676_013493 [Syzygium grande]|nr:hypothetical protein NL676_013493 [Syzygium grande]
MHFAGHANLAAITTAKPQQPSPIDGRDREEEEKQPEAKPSASSSSSSSAVGGVHCEGPVHGVHTEECGAVPVQERDSFDDRCRRQLLTLGELATALRKHPAGHATEPASRSNAQAEDELGLPAVPRAKEITCLLDNVSVLRKKMETPAAETRCRQVYLIM